MAKDLKKGTAVKFKVYDNLFKDCIVATGTITRHFIGKLWKIVPDGHSRLSGGEMMVHEKFIREA